MSKKRIGFIGYGVIGEQIGQFLSRKYTGAEPEFFYFDDNLFSQGKENAFPFNDFDTNKFSDLDFYVGLGYRHLGIKSEIYSQLKKNKYSIPSFIHPTAYVDRAAVTGNGVIIYPMCNIGTMVTIEDGVLINNSSVVSHDSFIGRCSFLSPGVILSGRVSVGQQSFLGTGTLIANDINVGKNVKTGIGTVITKDVEDGLSVVGNPMKIVNELKIK